jgi:hypothetical protein
MILTVFRPKRIKNGKVQITRSYRGRYRLDEEKKITDIPLHTTDRRVAQQRIEQIVKEKQIWRRSAYLPLMPSAWPRKRALKGISPTT